MVVRCYPELKQRVLDNVRTLRGVKNDKGQCYYVNKQLPEALVEQDRETRSHIKEIKQKEEGMQNDQKTKIEVRSGSLTLFEQRNSEKKVQSPTTLDLFPGKAERDKIDKIKISSDTHGEEAANSLHMQLRHPTLQKYAEVTLKQGNYTVWQTTLQWHIN